MSTISREAAEAALQERVSHFQEFSHQTLARFCAELEREKLQLDFEWQDEFEELQRATAALREENARLRLVDVPHWVLELSDSIPAHKVLENARMTQEVFLPWVSKLTRDLANERDELRAECERLRQQLNSANQQQQLKAI